MRIESSIEARSLSRGFSSLPRGAAAYSTHGRPPPRRLEPPPVVDPEIEGRTMAQRSHVRRAAERDGPHPRAPGRGLDRLARLRAARARRGLGRAGGALAQRARVRGRRPALGSRAEVLPGLREPDAVAAVPLLHPALRLRRRLVAAYVAANRRFRDAVLEEL